MAKKDIRFFARELAKFYEQAEQILSDAGLATQDVMFSPEEQKQFSIYKAEVDNNLSLLSVALSSAAQGKLSSLVGSVKQQEKAFLEPLNEALNNLADPNFPAEQIEPTERLIAQYNDKLRAVSATLDTLSAIEEWANFPAKRKKRARLLSNFRPMPLHERLVMYYQSSKMFDALRQAIDNFRLYVNSLNTAARGSDPVDDLSE